MGRMPLGRHSGHTRSNLSRIALLAILAGAAAQPAAAQTGPGQSAPAQPGAQQAVLAEPGARLHAGPSQRLYTVLELTQPTRLTIAGEPVGGMIPVAYPADLPAYVPASAVEQTGDNTLRITRATRLIAPHAAEGVEGSWRSLLKRPLPPGAELTIVSIVRADAPDNQTPGSESPEVLGYMVQPPRGAVAYIAQSDASPGTTPTPNADTTPGETTTDSQAPVETNLLDPMVPPGEVANTPQPIAKDSLATNQPVMIDQGGAEPTKAPPTSAQPTAPTTGDGPLTPAQLEALYQTARAGETFEDELDALLTEHQRTLEALETDAFNAHIRSQLEQRIAYLEMRIAFRDGPARIASERDGDTSVSERMAKRIEEFTAGRGYTMVGRLVPSRIYDGSTLPKLYRVRSPDALGRTLGYVRPGQRDLTPYLNKVVGVAGKVEDGPGGTKIITPVRIDAVEDGG